MAVYCPIYDPVTHSWYIIIHGPRGSYKKHIISPLYYYYSMGVKPPVGAKFTPEDYADFDLDLEDSQYLSYSTPLFFSSLPPISSLAAPISTNSSQASPTSVSEIDPLSDHKNPLLMPNFGSSSAYSPFLNPSTSSTASSPQLLSNEAATLKNVVSFNKKLDAMESLLFPSLHEGQSGSSLSLPTSPFISSLADPFATNTAKMDNSSSLKHPSTLSYLLTLPSTSSNLSYHLPSTSSGYVNVPPYLPQINSQCPVHGAAATNSFNVKNYPPLPADYDESMAYDMFLDDFDKTAMEADDYDF